MQKIIHYCWFGGKPLPKLARNCIKSWKKFLPDFEIKEWNESNFDVNCTSFSKKAYECKKWGFVADVARVYALEQYGGIYFDTDMMITKNIDFLLENNVFIGWENHVHVAVGVLGVRDKHNSFIEELMAFYRTTEFDLNDIYNITIPVIFSKILKQNYGLTSKSKEIQVLKDDIHVYPRDYFYPMSYDNQSNEFTDNSCMIHYYDASWASRRERNAVRIIRVVGTDNYHRISKVVTFIKRQIARVIKLILFPITLRRRKAYKQLLIDRFEQSLATKFNQLSSDHYIAIYQENWLGTKNATQYLFANTLGMIEVNDFEASRVAEEILKKDVDLVIFSAFDTSWEKIIRRLKERKQSIVIKILWHGNNSLLSEKYDWIAFSRIIDLYNTQLIDEIGYVKKSMYEFYKAKGFNCSFVMNYFELEDVEQYKNDQVKNEYTRIGLYASGDRWVKNFYNQLSAASLVENAIIDCIPVSFKTYEFASIINANIYGETQSIDRNQLLKRMAQNDINLYVTYTECAPIIPLESLELGVPCITSNNHHYFEGTKLEEYLVVNANDNITKIHQQIELCLINKEFIIELYQEWKKNYIREAKKSVQSFLDIKDDKSLITTEV